MCFSVEFSHHLSWLKPVQDLSETAKQSRGAIRVSDLQQAIATCDVVLAQNPQSSLAASLRNKLCVLLSEGSTASEPECNAAIPPDIPQGIAAKHAMPRENPIFSSFAEARQSLENGLNRTFALLARSTVKHTDDLFALAEFWREQVGLASLRGDGIVSLDSYASAPKAWIVIIPPNHKLMQEQPATLSVDTSHDLNLLYIKPFACTEEFNGIAVTHELVHLKDFVTGREPKRPSRTEYIDGEHRAFSCEIATADLVTNGNFSQAIEEFIRHGNLTMNTMIELGLHPEDSALETMVASVDAHARLPQSRSFSEANMRASLYLFASGFATAKRENCDAGDPTILQKKLIETIYQGREFLPKK